MRETTLFGHLQSLAKYIQQVEQAARLGITGEAVRAQALQQLLIKKGHITEAEFTAEVGEVIRKANEVKPEEAPATEPQKVELSTPTPEQVADIQKSAEGSK